MRNILTITFDTLREALARKVFIVFFVVSSLVIAGYLLFLLVVASDDIISILAGENKAEEISMIIATLQTMIASPLFGFGLLISIFATAGFIPSMLEKGNIDILLSKPVTRSEIILGKFFGGVLIVFLNIAYLVIGIWFITAIKFSYWDFTFLNTAVFITFTFAVLYAMTILTGILTKSSVLGMMASYLIFLFVSPILTMREDFLENAGDIVKYILNGLYYIIPKTAELGAISVGFAAGNEILDYQPIISSFLFMTGMIILSIIIFNRKDY